MGAIGWDELVQGTAVFFISSALKDDPALVAIREGLYAWADQKGVPVWMFEDEKLKGIWDQKSRAKDLRTCLVALEQCDAYVGLIHNSYGGSGRHHAVGIAFTDLEVFHAIRTEKPILLYVVEPAARQTETDALLTMLQQLLPKSFRGVGDRDEVLSWIKNDLQKMQNGRLPATRLRLGRFLEATSRLRWAEITSTTGLTATPPGSGDTQDVSSSEAARWRQQMADLGAQDKQVQQIGLSGLYSQLAQISWEHGCCPNAQLVWDDFCGAWMKANVWHANHHYGRLSCLGVLNIQMHVRCVQAMGDELKVLDPLTLLEDNEALGSTEWVRAYTLGGALGSEYYSLGKQKPEGRRRQFMLTRAERLTKAAERVAGKVEHPEAYTAGLAAVLGHIYLALGGRTKDVVSEFKRSLELRRAAGTERAGIAEAKGNLGHILFRNGRAREGLRMLEEAAVDLCECRKEGFAARIKLKLADAYLRKFRWRDAVREIREADSICRFHGIALRDAADGTARMVLGGLRAVANRRPLQTVVTEDGYEFVG